MTKNEGYWYSHLQESLKISKPRCKQPTDEPVTAAGGSVLVCWQQDGLLLVSVRRADTLEMSQRKEERGSPQLCSWFLVKKHLSFWRLMLTSRTFFFFLLCWLKWKTSVLLSRGKHLLTKKMRCPTWPSFLSLEQPALLLFIHSCTFPYLRVSSKTSKEAQSNFEIVSNQMLNLWWQHYY